MPAPRITQEGEPESRALAIEWQARLNQARAARCGL